MIVGRFVDDLFETTLRVTYATRKRGVSDGRKVASETKTNQVVVVRLRPTL